MASLCANWQRSDTISYGVLDAALREVRVFLCALRLRIRTLRIISSLRSPSFRPEDPSGNARIVGTQLATSALTSFTKVSKRRYPPPHFFVSADSTRLS